MGLIAIRNIVGSNIGLELKGNMIEVQQDKTNQKELEEAAKTLSALQFGEAVRKRLKELKWHQSDLADAIFTGQPVISQIVRGDYRNLTLDWVTRIAKALKMPPTELARAYWQLEDLDALQEEQNVLEKIRELLTEHYNIGGTLIEDEVTAQHPPTTIPNEPKNEQAQSGENTVVDIQKRQAEERKQARQKHREENKPLDAQGDKP